MLQHTVAVGFLALQEARVAQTGRNAGSEKSAYPGWMVPEADWSSREDFLFGDPAGLGETEDLGGERQPLEVVARVPGGGGRMVIWAIESGLGWAERSRGMGTYFPYRQPQRMAQQDVAATPWGSGVQLLDGR